MFGEVHNRVPADISKLEQTNAGWVLRYHFVPTETEGMMDCIERLFAQMRKPRKEIVKKIVEDAGDVFIPSDYGYED